MIEHLGFNYTYRVHRGSDSGCYPTIFLSGAFQGMDSWKSFCKYFLEKGKTTIVSDLPGAGKSDDLPLEYGPDYYVDAVCKLLDELGYNKVSVLGPSYGGHIAYRFAQLHPERVNKLMLVGAIEQLPENYLDDLEYSFKLVKSGNGREFADNMLGFSGPQVGNGLICTDPDKKINRQKLSTKLIRTQLSNMSDYDINRYITNTKRLMLHGKMDLSNPPMVDTLVFTGEHDCFTKPEYCRDLAKSIPGAKFTTVKEADHLLHFQQFDTTAELWYNFAYDLPLDGIPNINEIETFR